MRSCRPHSLRHLPLHQSLHQRHNSEIHRPRLRSAVHRPSHRRHLQRRQLLTGSPSHRQALPAQKRRRRRPAPPSPNLLPRRRILHGVRLLPHLPPPPQLARRQSSNRRGVGKLQISPRAPPPHCLPRFMARAKMGFLSLRRRRNRTMAQQLRRFGAFLLGRRQLRWQHRAPHGDPGRAGEPGSGDKAKRDVPQLPVFPGEESHRKRISDSVFV